jgi:WD40 repeat protein
VRIWDVASGAELKRFEANPPRRDYSVFSADGRQIIACGDGISTIRVWDIEIGELVLESDVASGIQCVAALPAGNRCLTAHRDGTMRVWEWKSAGGKASP